MRKPRLRALPLLAAALVAVSIASVAGYIVERRRVQAEVAAEIMARDDRHAIQLAESVGQHVDGLIRLFDLSLTQLRATYANGDGTFNTLMAATLAELPAGSVRRVTITDAQGSEIYASDGIGLGVDVHDRPHFRFHADGGADRLYIGEPVRTRVGTPDWVIPISRAIRRNNAFIGVITIILQPEYLSAALRSGTLDPGDIVAVCDTQGVFYARSHSLDKALGRRTPPDRPFLDPSRGDGTTFRAMSSVDGIPVDFAWRHLAPWNLIAVVAMDERAELASVRVGIDAGTLLGNWGLFAVVLFAAIAALVLLLADRQQLQLTGREHLLRSIMDSLHDSVVVLDQSGTIIRVNASWRRIAAANNANAATLLGTGLNYLEICRQSSAANPRSAELAAGLEAVLAGRLAQFSQEYECHSPDEERWFVLTATPLTGRKPGLVITHANVTERKRSETAALREHLRLQTILKTAGDGIHILDTTGRLVEANDAFLAMLGLDADCIGKAHIPDWDAGMQQADIDSRMQAMLRDGATQVFETRHRRRDGAIIDVEINARCIEIAGERFIYNAARDITERKLTVTRLRESEERWHSLFTSSRIVMLLIDPVDGRIVDANAMAAEYYGWDQAQLRSMRISEINVQPPAQTAAALHGASQASQYFAHFRHRLQNGAVRDVEAHAGPVRMGLGKRTLVLSIIIDITERRQAEEQQRLAATVFTHAREGILISDAQNRIIDVNAAFCRITGFSRAEVLGNSPQLLSSGRQSPAFYATMWQQLEQEGSWSGEIWNRRRDGEVYAEILTISKVFDEAGNLANYVALFTDITPIKQQQQRLEHIAHFDVLTGLPNRVLLADRLGQALAQCRRHGRTLAVLYIDLDGFKDVNDRLGHDAGDALLVELAQRMRLALREGDTIARFGGDEFVAVLVDLSHPPDYAIVLERLLRAASAPVPLGEATAKVSASIGITLYPQDASDADQLIRHADQAMYTAKQSGRNRAHLFDLAEHSAIRAQRERRVRILQALECNEFVMHYQPKVDMAQGTVVGAEALIRWNHPDRGMLLPAQFLPAVEDQLLSVQLGEWVLQAVLGQVARWHQAGLEIVVSANISPRHLQDPRFVQRLQQLLAAFPGLPPRLLELEILESSAIEDIDQVGALVRRCQELGVRFALDDFGTGYSALTYLRRLPADLIKIDQSFVRDMLIDRDDYAIVDGVLALARGFDRAVIAEGVETIAHGEALLRLGCRLGQGFGIARPMPAEQLPGWIAAWQPPALWRSAAGGALDAA